jgi:surface protein
VGLYAVYPAQPNVIALSCSNPYTINFGDGTTTNYGAGIQADYAYNYNDPDLAGTDGPVTFTASTDLVNRTAHGYTNGMMVQFYNIVTTTGITEAQYYYVINATANTFQVSATVGGAALDFVGDGSATLLPYKIATVTITPQAGQNIQVVNFNLRVNTPVGLTQGYATGWLDLAIALPQLFGLTIGGTNVTHSNLQQVRLLTLGSNATSFQNLFNNCRNLQSVIITASTASVTDTSFMFSVCTSLRSAPLFNTAAVTNMSNMFQNCRSLTSVPLYNTANVTNMSSMFFVCRNLKSVPLFNTAAVTNMSSMFNTCSSLSSVPLFNTASVTLMPGMFGNCTSLTSIPLFNTALVQSMDSAFSNCRFTTIPLLNTSAVINMNSMFNGCSALTSVPLLNTSAVQNMSNMFNGCTSLISVPRFNTVSATLMSGMFGNCDILESVPLFNTASVGNMSNMFQNCGALRSVPLFNTTSAQNMSGMFQGCSNLKEIPLFNNAAVTNMNFTFQSCNQLRSVPAITIPANTNTVNIFSTCSSLARIQAKFFTTSFSVANCLLSTTAIPELFDNLAPLTTATLGQTVTISGNYGTFGNQTTRFASPTSGSVTVAMSDTSNVAIGQLVTGTGTTITQQPAATSNVTANTLTLNSHGLTNGKRVAFTNLGSTTGVVAYTPYFVVNATANTFQIALTAGGAPIDLTGSNGSMNFRCPNFVTAINPNVSITLDTPATLTTTNASWVFRGLDISTALLKGWTVTI